MLELYRWDGIDSLQLLEEIRKRLIIPKIFSIDVISIRRTKLFIIIELKLHYVKNNKHIDKLKFKTKYNKTDLEIINKLSEKINYKIEELVLKFI